MVDRAAMKHAISRAQVEVSSMASQVSWEGPTHRTDNVTGRCTTYRDIVKMREMMVADAVFVCTDPVTGCVEPYRHCVKPF